ncbi:hypothetical protein BC827DRAFT_1266296 [Russula dissimulans]|nr:hypothetical protein BC827DRAFT_1266296 [Russula dissimulans]
MSTTTTLVSPSQRLRIAIGLAALKYKPPDQSIQSYTLDLKYNFCRSATRSISEASDSWRKRALELEAELHASRATATQADIEGPKEFLARRSSLAPAEDDAIEPIPTTSKKRHKQTKKHPQPSEVRRRPALEVPNPPTSTHERTDIMPSDSKRASSPLRTNMNIFSSLHALDSFVMQTAAKPASPPDLVAAATIKCLEALHTLLMRAISPTPVALENATPREALDAIERIISHILRRVVPILKRAYIESSSAVRLQSHASSIEDEPIPPISALDLVLGRVIIGLLVPAIRAFVPCTLTKRECILSSPRLKSPKKELADGEQLLSLVAVVLDIFPDRQYTILHDSVALEAIRALTSLIVDRPSRLPHGQLTPAQRIYRIARKDALHFLCDAALLALRRSAPAPQGSQAEMLRAALAEALGNLALTQSIRDGGSGLDIVEEHRVIAVLERAWSLGLRVGHIGGDIDDAEVDASGNDVHGQDGDVAMTDMIGMDAAKEDRPGVILDRRKSLS